MHIEEIARMLPVEGRTDLSAIYIGLAKNAALYKPLEFYLGGSTERTRFRRKQSTAKHKVRFNLDLGIFGIYNQPPRHSGHRLTLNRGSRKPRLDFNGQLLQRTGDTSQRIFARNERQVGQIDIDRQTRHILDKKVHGGSALQRKTVMLLKQR